MVLSSLSDALTDRLGELWAAEQRVRVVKLSVAAAKVAALNPESDGAFDVAAAGVADYFGQLVRDRLGKSYLILPAE